jgi:hypothetical protein
MHLFWLYGFGKKNPRAAAAHFTDSHFRHFTAASKKREKDSEKSLLTIKK